MRFNPGDGKIVLTADIMEELTNALDEWFVTAGLDRVVPKETHAVHTVREEIDPLRSARIVLLGVPSEPLQGVINRADFPRVVGGTRGSYPVELSGVSEDGAPQRGLRGVGAASKHSPPCRPRGEGGRSIRVYHDVRGGEQGLAQRGDLGHVLFCLLPSFKALVVAQNPDRVWLGLLPRCVDPRYMPKADPVKDRGFFNRAGGEGLVLALENPEDGGVCGGIGGDGFNILSLFPCLP